MIVHSPAHDSFAAVMCSRLSEPSGLAKWSQTVLEDVSRQGWTGSARIGMSLNKLSEVEAFRAQATIAQTCPHSSWSESKRLLACAGSPGRSAATLFSRCAQLPHCQHGCCFSFNRLSCQGKLSFLTSISSSASVHGDELTQPLVCKARSESRGP